MRRIFALANMHTLDILQLKGARVGVERKKGNEIFQQNGGIDPDQARILHEHVVELTNYNVVQAIRSISDRLKKDGHETHVTCAKILGRVPEVISKR